MPYPPPLFLGIDLDPAPPRRLLGIKLKPRPTGGGDGGTMKRAREEQEHITQTSICPKKPKIADSDDEYYSSSDDESPPSPPKKVIGKEQWKAWTHKPFDYQKPQIAGLVRTLRSEKDGGLGSNVAIDGSKMGNGKTIVALEVAKGLSYRNIVVLCPTSAVGHWVQHAAEYGLALPPKGVEVVGETPVPVGPEDDSGGASRTVIIHYEGAMAAKASPIGKIDRDDSSTFELNEWLRELIEDIGTLVIFDESHYFKNHNTKRFMMGLALCEAVGRSRGRSKLLLLSATLFDDEAKHVTAYIRLVEAACDCSVTQLHCRLAQRLDMAEKEVEGSMKGEGETIWHPDPPANRHRTGCNKCGLYSNKSIFMSGLRALRHEMRREGQDNVGKGGGGEDPDLTSRSRQFMRVLTLDPSSDDQSRQIGDILEEWNQKSLDRMVSAQDDDEGGGIFAQLHKLECIKAPLLAEQVFRMLEDHRAADPSGSAKPHLLLFFNFLEPQKLFSQRLSELERDSGRLIFGEAGGGSKVEDSIQIVTGEVKAHDRGLIVRKFNNPEDPCRILLATLGTLTEAVSLDDRTPEGRCPRFLFVMPSFHYIKTKQACGRVRRGNLTTSKSVVFFVYMGGDHFGLESLIMSRSLQKGKTLTKLHDTAKLSLMPGAQPFTTEDERRFAVHRYRQEDETELETASMASDAPKDDDEKTEKIYRELLLRTTVDRLLGRDLDDIRERNQSVTVEVPNIKRICAAVEDRSIDKSTTYNALRAEAEELCTPGAWTKMLGMKSARAFFKKRFGRDDPTLESPAHFLCKARKRGNGRKDVFYDVRYSFLDAFRHLHAGSDAKGRERFISNFFKK